MKQGGYPTCGDCVFFDKESWGFYDSNLCVCVGDGRKRWVGTAAKGCDDFLDYTNAHGLIRTFLTLRA
jgi:hypothetical protein